MNGMGGRGDDKYGWIFSTFISGTEPFLHSTTNELKIFKKTRVEGNHLYLRLQCLSLNGLNSLINCLQ